MLKANAYRPSDVGIPCEHAAPKKPTGWTFMMVLNLSPFLEVPVVAPLFQLWGRDFPVLGWNDKDEIDRCGSCFDRVIDKRHAAIREGKRSS